MSFPINWNPLYAPLGQTAPLLSNIRPGANVIKLFTLVIYHHTMVLLSSCVIKHFDCGKYHRMVLKKPDKKVYNNGISWLT
jgi:hypothetical protein